MQLRDLKAPLCILAVRFGGVVLALWGLLWGLVLVLAHRPVGSFLGVLGYLVFLSACVVSIAAGLSVTVWSVLATWGVDEEAGGWRPRFLRIWRRAGPHVLGLAICTVVAVLMSAAMTSWPMRLVHVDLVVSRVFVLQSVRAIEVAESGARAEWSEVALRSTVMLLNLTLAFFAFELAMFLRRTSLFRRKSFLGTKAAALVGVCVVFLPFVCYPKVKGFVKARRFRRNSSVAVVTYVGYHGLLISTTQSREREKSGGISGRDNEWTRSFAVSEERMSELVEILVDGGFFEMEAYLYLYGASEEGWETIRVADGVSEHKVSSYLDLGEPGVEEFEELRDRIIDWLGLGERWWEDGQGGTGDDEEDSW